MLSKINAASLQGIHARLITIETRCSKGIRFMLVGLPDASVKESHERMVSAIQESGYSFPRQQIVINMAPADVRKEGASFDLPLSLGVLMASSQIKSSRDFTNSIFVGELSLDGTVLPVRGTLAIAIMAKERGFSELFVPKENAMEAAVVKGINVYGIASLKEVVDFLSGEITIEPEIVDIESDFKKLRRSYHADFADVKGQENVKRALEVAASGGHNLLMIGPPGAGKSMLAKRLPSILPPFAIAESIETTIIHSISGKLGKNISLLYNRPFRAPHHTISNVALVGGGTMARPGEISLAHNGVLFLDELPEFSRSALEVLRQPLEDGHITISRSSYIADYPARFMLIASMNPCPCGYFNHPTRTCTCSASAVRKYLGKISGPLLDRFDIHVEITPLSFEKMAARKDGEPSEKIAERILKAREIQERRFHDEEKIYCNAQLTPKLSKKWMTLSDQCLALLKNAMHRFNLSARAYDKILKVSRTIADLEGSEEIVPAHIAEAIGYRTLDKSYWDS